MDQLEYVFFLNSGSKITHSQIVARCVAIIDIIYKNVTFIRLNLIKIIHQNAPDCITDFKIFSGIMPPNPLASLWPIVLLFLYESSHFLFRNLSKYKPNASIVACFQKFTQKLSTP